MSAIDAQTIVGTVPKSAIEEVRVTLSTFANRELIDVRIFADIAGEGAEKLATKKGVSLPVAKLPALLEVLRDAEAEARRRGTLGSAA